jgi:glutamyl-tRNA reductase
LVEADVVITSTSAPGYVIDYDTVASLRKSRRGRTQFFIDLAVPRDVEPRIEGLDGIFVYNIDDFSRVVSETLSARSREAERAEAIVASEAQGFDRWADAEQATPTIVALRARLRAALEAELGRSLRGRLKHLNADDRVALSRMIEASVNRLLHGPSVRLRQAALERGSDSLSLSELNAALSELFALGSDTQEELGPTEELRSESEAPRRDPDLISEGRG